MASNEILIAEDWIFSTLNGDATLLSLLGGSGHIFSRKAIPGTLPAVVFQNQSAIDQATNSDYRILTDSNYLIKVIGETQSLMDLQPIYDRVELLLHRKNYIATSHIPGMMLSCSRQRPFYMEEVTGGRTYLHLGGFYRILTQA